MNITAYRKVRAEQQRLIIMKRRVAEWWQQTHPRDIQFPSLAEALSAVGLIHIEQVEVEQETPTDGTKH